MKKSRIHNQKTTIKRIFLITKCFLCITPMLAYMYIALQASLFQIDVQGMLQASPNVAIVFLISMMNPYIAYLLHLMEKQLQNGDTAYVCVNMLLLLLAQLLTLNVFYFIMLAYVFYKTYHTYRLDMKTILSTFHLKTLFYQGGGSMMIVMLSSICFYATMHLI